MKNALQSATMAMISISKMKIHLITFNLKKNSVQWIKMEPFKNVKNSHEKIHYLTKGFFQGFQLYYKKDIYKINTSNHTHSHI